ncbi:MAG: preprotein translocase subunit SecE [Legionellales bacterium]|nr:preprotein translocase subunit SecE [Legionellales bacterium]|tara:strand:+ start:1140 stop:1520 length:381 start_codon:yes stop_codon:yes gene_type:complete
MNKKVTQVSNEKNAMSTLDTALWFFLVFFLAFAFYFNYTSSQYSLPIRMLAWFIVIAASIAVASLTQKGKDFYEFAQLAYVELIKVVWPSREEVMKMALMVAVMVAAASTLLWLIDTGFLWIMRQI